MKVLIAAAGTAGHINPAISIANIIKERNKNSKIIFLGTTRGLENDLVPRAGYELKTINAYGLSRNLSLENLRKMRKTIKGVFEAKKIVKEFNPDIVIGTGGYICGAAVLAANANKIPVLLHESNAFPGKAIKMAARKTNTILVSFQDAIQRIPKCENIVYTGTPIKIKKKDYTSAQKKQILNSLGLVDTKPVVLIFGGSQGAQKINETICDIIENNKNNNYQIVWAAGPKQFDIIKNRFAKQNINIDNILNCKVLPYIYNMEELENVADLVVARSGAMTITEISNLAKPSILIPLPNVSNNHQMYNAKVLEKVGAAIIINNEELTGELLNNKIQEIVTDKSKIDQMSQNAYTLANSDVEDKIYAEIIKLLRTPSKSLN